MEQSSVEYHADTQPMGVRIFFDGPLSVNHPEAFFEVEPIQGERYPSRQELRIERVPGTELKQAVGTLHFRRGQDGENRTIRLTINSWPGDPLQFFLSTSFLFNLTYRAEMQQWVVSNFHRSEALPGTGGRICLEQALITPGYITMSVGRHLICPPTASNVSMTVNTSVSRECDC